MPLIEADHPALSQRSKIQSAFLGELEAELGTVRNRVIDLSQRLADHGFYGPPEEASASAPVESSTRGRLADQVRDITHSLSRVEYQLTQLIGN